MKSIISILLLSILFFACKTTNNNTENSKGDEIASKKVELDKNRIEILDFYGTHRCTTCKNIEANTRYTLNHVFKKELDDGTIVFKTINFDDDKNEKIVTDYLAYGTSLFFNVIKNGKEKHIDLSTFSFKWGDNKEKYSRMLEEKIREQLDELRQ